jgi:hydroxymethylglutaryl-CoA lyase
MTHIQINEVGPRDGLQNEKVTIPTDTKIQFINALSDSGLTYIEATSFVSPKWVPQLADHHDVFLGINKQDNIRYPALVPNKKGMLAAIECEVADVAVFTAASEQFTEKNTNCTIAESLDRIAEITQLAAEHSIHVRGYISCVIACPYAGDTDPELVTQITHQLLELGCYEVSLGDTIGVGQPDQTHQLLTSVLSDVDPAMVAMHFHDTHKHALDNIKTSLDMGIHSYDSSVGGLGGCPYAQGATGNVSTQEVVNLLHSLGYETGIDIDKLNDAYQLIAKVQT